MPLRAADSCGLGGRKGNAPQFGGFVFVGHQQPGVRRSWTGDFEELRALYRRRSRELVGARLASLQQIVASRDSPGLGTFLETGRKIPPGSPEVCAWCNKRIALRPSPGSREFPALTCQVCLRWHCEKCRADKVDMTFFCCVFGFTLGRVKPRHAESQLARPNVASSRVVWYLRKPHRCASMAPSSA